MGVIIIAEAGVNHNGDIRLAKELIDAAKKAGADYIKFQTFVPQNLVSRYAQKAEYQKKSTGSGDTQLSMLENLALSFADFKELKEYCEERKIGFLSTPFDWESMEFLDSLNLDFWKVPSGEITDLPYLEKIGKTGKKVVLSTGMSELEEIDAALKILKKEGTKDMTLLHCNTEYPTPFGDVNLLAMTQMHRQWNIPVGYSDHTTGIEVPIAAVALGASVIEKHFTLDRKMKGPDHVASLEPDELKKMVTAIRHIEEALGDGEKKRTESEKKNIAIVRKSIVAKCEIKKGEIFSTENLTVKRPGNGISPMRWHEFLGKKATRDYRTDQLVEE